MFPNPPPLLAPYIFHLGLAAAGLPSMAALDTSEVYDSITHFVPYYFGSETGQQAVKTNRLCRDLMSEGLTSKKYIKCKYELESLVLDLIGLEELNLEKCVISKVHNTIAECPVMIWLKPHMISVTDALLVSDIKSRLAPKGKNDHEYDSTALVNGVKSKVKIIVHGHQEASEENHGDTDGGNLKKKTN